MFVSRRASFSSAVRIEQGALTDATVLIAGETGAGKEVVAHHLYDLNAQAHEPIVANGVALTPALVEGELFGSQRPPMACTPSAVHSGSYDVGDPTLTSPGLTTIRPMGNTPVNFAARQDIRCGSSGPPSRRRIPKTCGTYRPSKVTFSV